jgi:two-component system sensor histidine kinase KdpD
MVEAAGRFRIYLGAAPGVGKTYAMLNEAQRRSQRGTDVAVGFVECHGRPRTRELEEGLELIPRRVVDYRGARFEEMDLDAVLARHPDLVVVDELAHTIFNGSGRNEKRWQDIIECLNAGIDVVTTVNIQHLESIADAAERITGSTSGSGCQIGYSVRPTRSNWSIHRRNSCAVGSSTAISARPSRFHRHSATSSGRTT